MRRVFRISLVVFFLNWMVLGGRSGALRGQQQNGANGSSGATPGMDMRGPHTLPEVHADDTMQRMMMGTPPGNLVETIEEHGASGTSVEPASTPTAMQMTMKDGWMLMVHGIAFVTDLQQTGPRGADKFFSTNWLMPMAQRKVGVGTLTVRAMFSLEPATVSGRFYPLLFQQGETAFGKPIVDGQHPHNFVMELAAIYDVKVGEKTLLTFYGGPTGDPALGPTAFPHRASAGENPVAALGHHQEDSTHIGADVVTAGVTQGWAGGGVRLEASGFHGREPDESRWTINQGAIDSWAMRLTVAAGKDWSGQVSYGRLKSPEQLFPTENQARTTASLMYNRPFRHGNWASTALWGRTRAIPDNGKENSSLFESTVRFAERNYAWTRIENVGRTNELLYPGVALPEGFVEAPLTHVQAYTVGFDRDLGVLERMVPHTAIALGAQETTYGVGEPLKAAYGDHPFGVAVFVRVRVKGKETGDY
jgi:hypothetical protein